MVIKFQDGFEVPIVSFNKLFIDGVTTFCFHVDPSYKEYGNYINGAFFLSLEDEDYWLLTKESLDLIYGKDN